MAITTPRKTESVPTLHALNICGLVSQFPHSFWRWTFFFLLINVVICICICKYTLSVPSRRASYSRYGYSQILAAIMSYERVRSPQECPDVEQLTIGHWERWNASRITQSDIEDVNTYHIHQWKRLGIPLSLQREDKKCGNVPYGPGRWVSRANCNPEGTTPCCYDNVCQSKSMVDCQCQGCYDLRREVKAEFADWVPKNTKCKVIVLT